MTFRSIALALTLACASGSALAAADVSVAATSYAVQTVAAPPAITTSGGGAVLSADQRQAYEAVFQAIRDGRWSV